LTRNAKAACGNQQERTKVLWVESVSLTKVFAHRGFSGAAPENTLSAFEKAVEAKADGVELDVHLSRDGHVIVMHDETVDRTTDGTGWIKDMTLAKLKQLDNGSWFHPSFQNEPVPTLGEVLERLEGVPVEINIELKNGIIRYPGLEQKVIAEVERFHVQGRVILSSFRHESLLAVKQARPGMQTGALYACGMVDPWVYAKYLGVDAVHPHHLAVTTGMIDGCHRHGIRVRPYTVNEEKEMKRLMDAGADAVITNYPDRMRKLLSPKEK
jgi:glycerophosphoryl diester phosphodiesterase